jgi:hypothetical protein
VSDSSNQGIWAAIGKAGLAIGVLLGAINLYSHFFTKDVAIEASGRCEPFIVPDTYLQTFKGTDVFLTADELEKLLPEKLDRKRLVALDNADANRKRGSKLESAAQKLDDIRSSCVFTVSNTGNKEAQDINFELPREGLYVLNKLGEQTKEAEFKKLIPIGKLNPGGKIQIGVWRSDGYSVVSPLELQDFRVTHTNGVVNVDFLPDNTTILGEVYERYPNAVLFTLIAVVIGAFILGMKAGAVDEKDRQKKEKEKLAETTDPSKAMNTAEVPAQIAPPVAEPVEVEADPPSPS